MFRLLHLYEDSLKRTGLSHGSLILRDTLSEDRDPEVMKESMRIEVFERAAEVSNSMKSLKTRAKKVKE